MVAIIVGVLAGAMVGANGMYESARKERDAAKRTLSSVQSKTSGSYKQIEDLGAASQIYADLAENRNNMEFEIQPQSMRKVMAGLKEEYFITTLNLELSSQEVLKLSGFKSKEWDAVKIHGVMNFGGLSDQYIYQFIEALEDKMPGAVSLTNLSLARRQPISIDVLSQISRGNPIETVSGAIEFDWYGFIAKPQVEEKK